MMRKRALCCLVAAVLGILPCWSLAEGDTEEVSITIFDEGGNVAGAYATDTYGDTIKINAKAVIVSTGGFGEDADRMGKLGIDLDDIRIIGTRPDGTGWKTGVRDPKNPDSNYCAKLLLADTSCVTSGIYERYFTVDGVRYHHIIDKDTLYPSTLFTSVTVVTKNSGLADALSTALFCMPLADGEALCEKLGDVEALWVLPDGELHMTSGMEAILVPDDTSGESQS